MDQPAHLSERPEYGDEPRRPLLRLVPEGARRILDIGCNRGAFGFEVKGRQAAEVWGVEPDAACAAVAAERLDRVINDTFNSGNPIPDNYFDLITFNDSLEHMVDPVLALELCRTKLVSGGRVQCCVPNMRNIENIEHLLFERDWRYEDRGVRDRTHLRFFTEKSIVRLFRELGFSIESVCGINDNWWDAKKPVRRLLFRLFPGYTSDMRSLQIVVTARFDRPTNVPAKSVVARQTLAG